MSESINCISMREFVASDYLSNANLKFDGESTNLQPLCSPEGDSSTQGSESLLHSLNASKLALLLAKTFVRMRLGPCTQNGNIIDLELLHLDSIVVGLKIEEVPKSIVHNCNNIFPGQVEEVDELELLASAVLDDPNQELNNGNPSQYQTSDVATTNDLPNHACGGRYSSQTTLTVLDINVLPAHSCTLDQSLSGLTPMQILGKHIQAIFSRANQQFSSLTNQTMRSDNYDTFGQRTPKLRMLEENSLFLTLLESGNYPISVCRLLSDMIDVGNCGKAENPFSSFDDVIDDLEHMSNHPHIFLYDPDNDFVSSNPLFGQRCCGRIDELTKLLDISTRLEQSVQGKTESQASIDRSNVALVSGVAGSGKSHLVQHLGRFLKNLGWIVQKEKFQREKQHESRQIVSSLFDKLISNIVEMRGGGNEDDTNYSLQATNAITNALDPSSLASLAMFIPSLLKLVPGVEKNVSLPTEAEKFHWQLVFLLSKLVEAILSLGRHIMICFDDLQWASIDMLMLIKEIIMSVGRNGGMQYFLFVGMYRDDEISASHPFASQLLALRESSNVYITEIKLPSLSKDDISEMIMTEVRLPGRLCSRLADIVHKRSSGHAIFVVQLLNSLVRDSTISYSPKKHCFDWDENKLSTLKTCDSVASLIVSNLSLLQDDALKSLQILSCFGVLIPMSLIKMLVDCPFGPERGIESFLPSLVESGAVEITGASVVFCHDLIQQHVYETSNMEDRQRLHRDIGNHIAAKIELDSCLIGKSSIHTDLEEMKLGETNSMQDSMVSQSYPLIAIATNQINFAGPKSVSDQSQQIRYSKWNLCAGNHAASNSNFQAALYYYKSGIAFLGDEVLWHEDFHQLCHQLHEGAGHMLFAIGDYPHAVEQAKAVINHVPFADSLEAQYILIRSLDSLGRYTDAVTKGLNLLRKLKFDIPTSDPSLSAVMEVLTETSKNASAYSFQQITSLDHIVDAKKRSIFKLVGAMIVSGFRSSSPYLPLIGCATVNYSLQNGICVESANAFLLIGYFKVSLEENYEEGRYWANVVYKILENAGDKCTNPIGQPVGIRVDIMSSMYLNFFYYPLRQTAFRLLKVHQRAKALGDIESGENLSLLSNSLQELIKSMLQHSKEGAKMAVSNKILVDGLVGHSIEDIFSDFGGVIVNEESLLADARSKKNFMLVESVNFRRFVSAFWMGDYAEANRCSKAISVVPTTKQIKIQTIIHAFYKGLIAFQLYRDGEGEEWLDEGKDVFDKMEIWMKNSPANFANKLLLLEAEHHASFCNIVAAKKAYEASVRSSRDHAFLHEQGLACELYGKFLASIVETNEAFVWFKCAHMCYIQWGAVAKAEQVWNDHNLGSSTAGGNYHEMPSTMKRKNG